MFADRMQDKIFAGKINDILIPSVNNAIKACLAGDLKASINIF
jgi:hypothetical protein